VAALHGNADDLANAVANNALRGVEALVLHDVGHEDTLLLAQDILHDGGG